MGKRCVDDLGAQYLLSLIKKKVKKTEFTTHTDDTDIHTTAEEKAKWNY